MPQFTLRAELLDDVLQDALELNKRLIWARKSLDIQRSARSRRRRCVFRILDAVSEHLDQAGGASQLIPEVDSIRISISDASQVVSRRGCQFKHRYDTRGNTQRVAHFAWEVSLGGAELIWGPAQSHNLPIPRARQLCGGCAWVDVG